jgi:hypothetical protein
MEALSDKRFSCWHCVRGKWVPITLTWLSSVSRAPKSNGWRYIPFRPRPFHRKLFLVHLHGKQLYLLEPRLRPVPRRAVEVPVVLEGASTATRKDELHHSSDVERSKQLSYCVLGVARLQERPDTCLRP